MWKRSELKNRAKDDLKGRYWVSFFVCLVCGILGGQNGGNISYNFGYNIGNIFSEYSSAASFEHELESFFDIFAFDAVFIIIFIVIMLIAIVIVLGVSSFLSNVVEVGKCKFFAHRTLDDRNFETLFSFFKKGQYMAVVKTMFITKLYIFLWSLLCVIPGIIKSYQYKMVPYILSENPTMPYHQALSISKRMTDGQKLDMWVLDLSFILWWIAGFLTCCVGGIFVNPYYEATWAQLYKVMREKYMGDLPTPPQPEEKNEEAIPMHEEPIQDSAEEEPTPEEPVQEQAEEEPIQEEPIQDESENS